MPDVPAAATPTRLQNTPELFAAQLREGRYNELRVALWFMLRRAHVRIGFDGARYDLDVLTAADECLKVEVKWDKAAARTGNLYFEVENTRRRLPSGIAATDAQWWCHVLGDGDEALLVPTDALRGLLAAGGFRQVHTRGADSNSRGYLVPRARLEALRGAHWVRLPTVEEFFGELFRRAQG